VAVNLNPDDRMSELARPSFGTLAAVSAYLAHQGHQITVPRPQIASVAVYADCTACGGHLAVTTARVSEGTRTDVRMSLALLGRCRPRETVVFTIAEHVDVTEGDAAYVVDDEGD
jgi:hypothetical protein